MDIRTTYVHIQFLYLVEGLFVNLYTKGINLYILLTVFFFFNKKKRNYVHSYGLITCQTLTPMVKCVQSKHFIKNLSLIWEGFWLVNVNFIIIIILE